MGLFRVFLLQSYKWDWVGMGWDWDLCVGLLYEHRFAVLIKVYILKCCHSSKGSLSQQKQMNFWHKAFEPPPLLLF